MQSYDFILLKKLAILFQTLLVDMTMQIQIPRQTLKDINTSNARYNYIHISTMTQNFVELNRIQLKRRYVLFFLINTKFKALNSVS